MNVFIIFAIKNIIAWKSSTETGVNALAPRQIRIITPVFHGRR